MSWGQLLPAMIWVAIGGAIAAGAYNLGLGALNRPGPGLFPFVIGVGMALLSLSVMATAFRVVKAPVLDTETRRVLPVVAVVAALVFYTVALERIGFVLCTLLFLIGLLGALGRSSWLTALTASVGITVGSYLIFAKLLKINLPIGPLGF
jgi:putative tricarboxylic transport membrane protein